MSNRKVLAVAGLALATGALACGPFFPWQLLDNRAQTLKATPVNSFAYEAKTLIPTPKDRLKPVETSDYSWASQAGDQNAEAAARELGAAETAGLTANQVAILRDARNAANGPEALVKGQGLPPAIQHYTAGAVAWHKGDLAFAKTEFETVYTMPGRERRSRIVWAAYMLGRVGAASNNPAMVRRGFEMARVFATHGAPDPLGLAVASFGEQARVHLTAAEALLAQSPNTVTVPGSDTPDSEAAKFSGHLLPQGAAAAFRSEIAEAIRLYGEQAAHGSDSGVQSLRIVAEFLLDRPDRIAAAAPAPLAERLMVAYALRLNTNNTIDITHWYANPSDADSAAAPQRPTLAALLAALKTQPHPAGADRIAALCYSLADWHCAQTFAAKANSPLAAWVQAKLATQKGDLAGAAKFYAAAVHGFPTDTSLEERSRKQVLGESGVVALARGDYVDALAKLWPVSGTYWSDVAYLAERVLTVDELKGFVDAHVPPGKMPKTDGWGYGFGAPFDSRVTLRNLLARRLMRAGRYDDAFGYFGDDKDRDAAKAYAQALADGKRKWGKVDRAAALFQAATIARKNGLEIMGTEGPPDSYYTEGNFEQGLGRAELEGKFITPGERARFKASNAVPPVRYHYRIVAANLASAAADLVPEKSQAFAAMLCHAAAWSSRDEERAKTLYQRYVKHGARVPFAKTFGEKCAAPDFKGAIVMERKLMVRDARRYVSRNRWWFAGGGAAGLALIGGLIALLILRRRRAA